MRAAGETPKPVRAKRYGWFRLYNDYPGHPLWRLIARQTGVSLAEVEAIATRILRCANKGRPRGSIAEFSCDLAAADLDMAPSEVVAVYQALEARGWIDQEYVATWDERQPDKEDGTAAKRQARRRSRLQAERGIHQETSHAVTGRDVGVTQCDVTAKDSDTDSSLPVTVLRAAPGTVLTAAEAAGYVPPRQRALPLPPVVMKERGRR